MQQHSEKIDYKYQENEHLIKRDSSDLENKCYVCFEEKPISNSNILTFTNESYSCSHGHIICFFCIMSSGTKKCMVCKEDIKMKLPSSTVTFLPVKMEQTDNSRDNVCIQVCFLFVALGIASYFFIRMLPS